MTWAKVYITDTPLIPFVIFAYNLKFTLSLFILPRTFVSCLARQQMKNCVCGGIEFWSPLNLVYKMTTKANGPGSETRREANLQRLESCLATQLMRTCINYFIIISPFYPTAEQRSPLHEPALYPLHTRSIPQESTLVHKVIFYKKSNHYINCCNGFVQKLWSRSSVRTCACCRWARTRCGRRTGRTMSAGSSRTRSRCWCSSTGTRTTARAGSCWSAPPTLTWVHPVIPLWLSKFNLSWISRKFVHI